MAAEQERWGRKNGLTRDDVLQLVEYWKDQTRSRGVAWEGWYMPALRALGCEDEDCIGPKNQFRAGKLFREAYALGPFPDRFAPLVYDAINAAADALATLAPTTTPKDFAMSSSVVARWARVAKAAWERLKQERERIPIPPIPPPVLPPPRQVAGTGLLLVALLLLWSDSKKGR